jgi:hypothetical protein
MFCLSNFSGAANTKAKKETNSHRNNKLMAVSKRVLSFAMLCLLANRSTTDVVNVVRAANTDGVSFQSFEINGPLDDILWCGKANEVILVHTTAGTIYRSRDRGDSWKKLSQLMANTGGRVQDSESYEH